MLYLALMYGIISMACLLAGLLCYQIPWFKQPASTSPRPLAIYCITGLMVISLTGQWLALFFPLNIATSLSVLGALMAIAIALKRKVSPALQAIWQSLRRLSLISVLALAALTIMVITLNAGITMMDDTESYHIQTIKWLQEYGTVPGIANLHLRYGLHSGWFTGIGILSPAIKGINTYQVVNGVLSCWLCFYFIEKLNAAFITRALPGAMSKYAGLLIVFILLLLTWPMIRGNASTANYDFIATACLLILFIEAIYAPELIKAEWILWPCYLFTVRIIHYPLLLLSLPLLSQVINAKQWKAFFFYCATALLFVIPFMARNVLLSGYPFFPVVQPDWFTADWKADKTIIHHFTTFTQTFNRIYPTLIPIKQAMTIRFPNWVPYWWQCQFGYNKPVLLMAGLGYVVGIVRMGTLKKRLGFYGAVVAVVMLIQLISWFVVSPDPRFVYGPLLAGVLLFFAAMPAINNTRFIQPGIKLLLPAISLICLLYAVRKIAIDEGYQNYALPYPLPQPPLTTVMIGNIQLQVPEKILGNWNARCYGTTLPCLYRVNPALRARGPQLKDGFKLDSSAIVPFSTVDSWE